MSESKHTPAPWTVILRGERGTFHIPEAQKHEAEHSGDGVDGYTVSKANARVIAAAPDLLAACEAMCAWFDRLNQKQDELLVQGQTLESASENWDAATLDTGFDMSQMQAAVAKARGGK